MDIFTLAVRHLISGDAFFSGVLVLVLAVAWRQLHLRGGERVVMLLLLVSAALIFCSATPLSYLEWGALLGVTLSWWLFARAARSLQESAPITKQQGSITAPLTRPWILTVLLLAVWAPSVFYQQLARMKPIRKIPLVAPLVILGDSITAGTGEGNVITWPHLVEKILVEPVTDLSRMGATLASTNARLDNSAAPPGTIVIELGGNDILSGVTPETFEAQLRRLLDRFRDRQLTFMFELPLPPLGNRYGQVQRRVAREFDVQLIPKRILAGVLISPETTVDSIHLNELGQQKLADAVADALSH